MADAYTVSRLGQAEGAGDAKALFLKVFGGEVYSTFERKVTLKELHRVRQIESGKSAQFPVIYKASTEYHTPGNEITGSVIEHNEITVPIDDLLISHVFIANIDEAMNHYDVRGPYATELGRALSEAYDKNVARNLWRAANANALFTGDTGGQQVTDADGDTSGSSLAASIFTARQKMEEADVPTDDGAISVAVKPAQFYLLAQETTAVINRDVGGQPGYAEGKITMVGGINVVKSNNYPWGTDDSSNTAIPVANRVDMSNTVCVAFHREAAFTVQLLGLSMEDDYQVNRQGTLMVAKFAVGHAPGLPKAAVEIQTA
jgi:hypothetical protein